MFWAPNLVFGVLVTSLSSLFTHIDHVRTKQTQTGTLKIHKHKKGLTHRMRYKTGRADWSTATSRALSFYRANALIFYLQLF
jgi:hypothetical protein